MLIEFVRHLEENVAMMFSDSGRRERGPGGIARCSLDARHTLALVFEPPRDMFEEARLRERLPKQRFQLRGQRRSIDGCSLLLGHSGDGFFLDEFALEGE